MSDLIAPSGNSQRKGRLVVHRETLKKITSQFEPGNLVLVAGRPSTGKTRFILDFLTERTGSPAASILFELEDSKQRVVERLRGLNLPESDNDVLFRPLSLHVDDSPARSVKEIIGAVEALIRSKPVSIVAVDYLQLMRWEQEDQREGLEHIAKELKALAKREKIVVILALQLSKDFDKYPDWRPTLCDLHQCGWLERYADYVLLLSRLGGGSEAGTETPPSTTGILAHVAKNRNGPTWESALYEELGPAACSSR